MIKETLRKRLGGLPVDVEFRFASSPLFREAYASLLDGEINTVINELIREEDFPIERWRVASQPFERMNSVRLMISDYAE